MEHFQGEGSGEIQGHVCRCHDVPGGMSHDGPEGVKEPRGRSTFPPCRQPNGHKQVNPSRADLGTWVLAAPLSWPVSLTAPSSHGALCGKGHGDLGTTQQGSATGNPYQAVPHPPVSQRGTPHPFPPQSAKATPAA